MKYDSLRLCCLTPEQRQRTCSYWYTITNGAIAHTAFRTRAGLDKYLKERNLTVDGLIPDEVGTFATMPIRGAYRTEMHWNDGTFPWLNGVHTRALSNGDYTTAVITHDDDGIRTVHTFNPNVHSRPVFDYFESEKLMA